MGDSIACGVAATPEAHGWLVLPADLPLIQAATLLQVAQALQSQPVVVPFYLGKPGHPVGFSALCREDLKKLTGDQGARAVVAKHAYFKLDVADAGVTFDVDTLDLLKQAEALMTR
jgi:molybdenum cofactor cytidylyltransferase